MPTKKELLEEAKELGLSPRANATHRELENAIAQVKEAKTKKEVVQPLDQQLPVETLEVEDDEFPDDGLLEESEAEVEQYEELVAEKEEEEEEKPGLLSEIPVAGVVQTTPTVWGQARFVPAETGDRLSNGSVAGDVYSQKSVLYTDGNSGHAHLNLERAYEIPEFLQSNDPDQRSSGDESLSEAARDAKSERDERYRRFVIGRSDRPNGRDALNK